MSGVNYVGGGGYLIVAEQLRAGQWPACNALVPLQTMRNPACVFMNRSVCGMAKPIKKPGRSRA
jgi:hypothetical protein